MAETKTIRKVVFPFAGFAPGIGGEFQLALANRFLDLISFGWYFGLGEMYKQLQQVRRDFGNIRRPNCWKFTQLLSARRVGIIRFF